MVFTVSAISVFGLFSLLTYEVHGHFCDGGHFCASPKECCQDGCCYVHTSRPAPPAQHDVLNLFFYNHWYFWCVVVATTLVVVCAWWAWKRRRSLCSCFSHRRPPSDRDSAGSCYPPPRYSRCGSFHHAPPPYTEVTSKPDLYPLVITYGDGDKGGSNYLMVHYFRNYIIRPPGSLSATSTAESLNSSFICNAANEANTIIPPPYSCAGGFEEWCGSGGCAPRTSILRSLSSLASDCPQQPHSNPPPRSHTAPLRIDDAPPIETSAPPSRDPSRLSRHTDLSPDADGRRSSFRETLISSPVVDTNYGIDFELLNYEYNGVGRAATDNEERPRLGSSPPINESRTQSREQVCEGDLESFRHLFIGAITSDGACDSPPRPTSPTQSRDSTIRNISKVKKNPKVRKTSLYMPLSTAPKRRSPIFESRPWGFRSSRSAPTTPASVMTPSGFVPGLLALSQKVSASGLSSRSSKLNEESNPLLDECEPQEPQSEGQF